jgi:hypothetical protein
LDRLPESTGTVSEAPWLLSLRSAAEGDAASLPTNGSADSQSAGLPPDALGLTLSGEGLRGAAFCLGVLQALARADWLRHVDYLSTVSGGGYIGAFLGRFFDSYRMRRAEPNFAPGVVQDRVARGLIDPESAPVVWLGRNANYVAPGGIDDAAGNLASTLRRLLSVYFVLGVFLLAVFGAFAAVGYLGGATGGRFGTFATAGGTSYSWIRALLPINDHLPGAVQGAWFASAEIVLWLAVAPLLLAYWLVSQDLPESFAAPILISAAIAAGTSLLLTGSPLVLVIVAASVFWCIASWAAARQEEGPADPRNPYRRMLAREHVSRRMASWLALTLLLVAVGAIDGIGRFLARTMPYGYSVIGSGALWVAGVTALLLILAWVLGAVIRGLAAISARGVRRAHPGLDGVGTFLALWLGALPFLVAISVASHALYGLGENYARGLAVTVVAVVVSVLFGTRESLPFLNQSGTISMRAGRFARAFLGAVNAARRVHPEGQDVTRPVAGDDTPFDQYHPEIIGGPLHLINCSVSETYDVASLRRVRHCGAENVTVGPAGMSVARFWHALWKEADPASSCRVLNPMGKEAPDPFLARQGGPIRVEPLGLQDWTVISAAASGPGDRSGTGRSASKLQGLAGFRSGYWWDSGLDARDRTERPIRRGLPRTLAAFLARAFRSQILLLSELAGRFGGPWTRHWYLTDACDCESTGAYELLRRRLPFLIVCDAGADPERQGFALARLIRLARVDLGAEVTEATPDHDALRQLGVPGENAEHLGAIADLLTRPAEPSLKHAALLRVRYPAPPPVSEPDPYLARRVSWMLYIKLTCTGDEPADIRSYAGAHPGFPDEVRRDAAFDERQWENYRLLGEHIGRCVFEKNQANT